MEIDPRNTSDDNMSSSPLGGDGRGEALYLTDEDTFATAKKYLREAVLTVQALRIPSVQPEYCVGN